MPVEWFGQRLRQARLAKGLTQQEMADRIQHDRTTYTKYELGRAEPPLRVAYEMAVLLDTTLDELLKPD